jgi:3'-phosphoadenosine 5'-phosphosulfate sulfotransferase (PAPS reductase)/FAD synthetase
VSYKRKKKLLLKLVAMKTLRNASFIIVTNTEIEMKEMMKNLRKYMTKKKLEVNVEKTKMMVFNKRKKKSEENERNSGKEGK